MQQLIGLILIVIFSFCGCATTPAVDNSTAIVPPSATMAPTVPSGPEGCPGADSEPALSVKTEAGPTLALCGFEDHEVVSPTGKRAFSEFTIYYTTPTNKQPQKLFNSEVAETFWAKPNEGKGLELEEVWFFSEQPKPALSRQITCEAEKCSVGDAKCVFTMKPNPFPKALPDFEKKRKTNALEQDGEELLDQIWAQALLGDKNSQTFYHGTAAGLDENLTEVFESNKKKLTDLKTLNCP